MCPAEISEGGAGENALSCESAIIMANFIYSNPESNWDAKVEEIRAMAQPNSMIRALSTDFSCVAQLKDTNNVRHAMCGFLACITWECLAVGYGPLFTDIAFTNIIHTTFGYIFCNMELYESIRDPEGYDSSDRDEKLSTHGWRLRSEEARQGWLASAYELLLSPRFSINFDVVEDSLPISEFSHQQLRIATKLLPSTSRVMLHTLLRSDLTERANRKLGPTSARRYPTGGLMDRQDSETKAGLAALSLRRLGYSEVESTRDILPNLLLEIGHARNLLTGLFDGKDLLGPARLYSRPMASYFCSTDNDSELDFGLPQLAMCSSVQVATQEAVKNILRLFQRESVSELFATRFQSYQVEPEERSSVKIGVCMKLSASSPETYQRIEALPFALDSLCRCLHDVLNDRNEITEPQRDLVRRLQQQFDKIVARPDFATISSEALYGEFLDIFVPKDSQAEMVSSLPFGPSYRIRRAAVVYLQRACGEGCYTEEYMGYDFSRGAGWLVTDCLDFCYGTMDIYRPSEASKALALVNRSR